MVQWNFNILSSKWDELKFKKNIAIWKIPKNHLIELYCTISHNRSYGETNILVNWTLIEMFWNNTLVPLEFLKYSTVSLIFFFFIIINDLTHSTSGLIFTSRYINKVMKYTFSNIRWISLTYHLGSVAENLSSQLLLNYIRGSLIGMYQTAHSVNTHLNLC